MTPNHSAGCPAAVPLAQIVERVIPGKTDATKKLRKSVISFCADPSARSLLLRGPVGVGKTTVARLIGFGKRISPLRPESAERHVRDVRFDAPGRIDPRLMPWFVELTVTGLVEELAAAQLFGIREGAASGVKEAAGVFERATGPQPPGGSRGRGSGREDPWHGAAVTGGVVFLDEIGDLSKTLQAKLLGVLAGSPYYRVGGEGDPDDERSFDGITIAATWQDLAPTRLRQDLLSRIGSSVIELPTIGDRIADLPGMVRNIEAAARTRLADRVERMVIEPDVDRPFYEALIESLSPLEDGQVAQLGSIDWAQYGEMRGLTRIVERAFLTGREVNELVSELPEPQVRRHPSGSSAEALYADLLATSAPGDSLSARVRQLESEARSSLSDRLAANPREVARIAARLGISEKALREQLRSLRRNRRSRVGRGSNQ